MNIFNQTMFHDSNNSIDEVFGEMVTITPQVTKPNFSPTPDSSRPVVCLLARFRNPPAIATLPGLPTKLDPHIQSRKPSFSFNRRTLPYGLQKGDIVMRMDCGEIYELHAPESDGIARSHCPATQLGNHNQ